MLKTCAIAVLLTGCAMSPPTETGSPIGLHGSALIGMTQERVLACAGPPVRQAAHATSTVLLYYREAALHEESFFSAKGSRPGYHHGCWATILVEDEHVTGTEFRPVPDPDADSHECQEIFTACAP